MSVPAERPEASIEPMMLYMGRLAREAARALALAPSEVKNQTLKAMAGKIAQNAQKILDANAQDVDTARAKGRDQAFLDRLMLNQARVAAMAKGICEVAALADPVGQVMASGNAVILRSGSESFLTSLVIANLLTEGVAEAGLPREAIQLVPTVDRAAVGFMLQGLGGAIDVIVPRGGKNLVARVQNEARVPVFAHLEGVCHVYVHAPADLDMAKKIVLNAKMRRTGVCGAAETLLVDRAAAPTQLKPLVEMLLDAGCEVRGDAAVRAVDTRVKPATEEDWSTEYLDAVISARVVDGVDAAIAHIERYGSHHTDSIVTEDQAAAEKFLREVDSAIVLHNASTQFADGGEFGFGAEIGIATGRFHARGPVGVEQLTTFKYRIHGSGQIRP